MSATDYEDLSRHIGHELVIAQYGKLSSSELQNVAIECLDCNEVLLDFPKNPEKECPEFVAGVRYALEYLEAEVFGDEIKWTDIWHDYVGDDKDANN